MATATYRDHPAACRIAGKRVLVVEDDADIRKMLRIVLESVGAAVSEASSPKQTIDMLHDAIIDAIVLDWHLAGATGGGVLSEIATLTPPFAGAILVISGDQRVTTAAMPAANPIAVLIKPFLPVDLIAALGGLISRTG